MINRSRRKINMVQILSVSQTVALFPLNQIRARINEERKCYVAELIRLYSYE